MRDFGRGVNRAAIFGEAADDAQASRPRHLFLVTAPAGVFDGQGARDVASAALCKERHELVQALAIFAKLEAQPTS